MIVPKLVAMIAKIAKICAQSIINSYYFLRISSKININAKNILSNIKKNPFKGLKKSVSIAAHIPEHINIVYRVLEDTSAVANDSFIFLKMFFMFHDRFFVAVKPVF